MKGPLTFLRGLALSYWPVDEGDDDGGRCADMGGGVLWGWVPGRVVIGPRGARLVYGLATNLRPIAEPECHRVSLCYRFLSYTALGRTLRHRLDERPHRARRCRWCGFGADAAPSPPFDQDTAVEVELSGWVWRRGYCCWGRYQRVLGVWLWGWCSHPAAVDRGGGDMPADFVGGFDGAEGFEDEVVSLCRRCADAWTLGSVLSEAELAAALGVSVRWIGGRHLKPCRQQ